MIIRYITVAQYRNEYGHQSYRGLMYFNGSRVTSVFPFRRKDGNTITVSLYDGNIITTRVLHADDLIELR